MRNWLLAGILAIVGSMCLADIAEAQRFRRGRAVYSDGYYNGPGYGSGYYGPGYYNDGANSGRYRNSNDGFNRSFYPPNSDDDQFNQQQRRQGDLDRDNRQDQAFVTVRVPSPDAQVWFDDHRTQQGGMQRMFETPSLESGNYSYKVRAKWRQDGKDMDQTRTVRVQPGQRVMVDFARANTGQRRQGEQVAPPRRNQENQRNQSNQNPSDPNERNQDQPRNPNPPRQDRTNPPNN
jgi:uncharacterized protein (TIGR03000 family)